MLATIINSKWVSKLEVYSKININSHRLFKISENTQFDEIIGDYQLIESSMRFNKSQHTHTLTHSPTHTHTHETK